MSLRRKGNKTTNKKGRWIYPLVSLLAPLLPADNVAHNQPVIVLNADDGFFSMYDKTERKMFLDKLDKMIIRISRAYDITQVFISVPSTPCVGDIHTAAMTGFLVTEQGEKGLLLCFAFLTSPDADRSPREYWLEEWRSIFGHEYRHVADYLELEVDPFTSDPYPYLNALRAAAKAEGIHTGFIEIDDVRVAKIVMQAMQELRTLMKTVEGEPHDDVQKSFVLFSTHLDDLKRDGRVVDILLGEIVTYYLLNNEQFRVATGITAKEELREAYNKFRDATRELREQNDGIGRLYEEMTAYARLAEKEGFKMKD